MITYSLSNNLKLWAILMYPQVYNSMLHTLHCSAILDLDFLDATYVNWAMQHSSSTSQVCYPPPHCTLQTLGIIPQETVPLPAVLSLVIGYDMLTLPPLSTPTSSTHFSCMMSSFHQQDLLFLQPSKRISTCILWQLHPSQAQAPLSYRTLQQGC